MPQTAANPILERAGQFGLRRDNGWVDELCKEVAEMPAQRQEPWIALLQQLAKPTCRCVEWGWLQRQGFFDIFSDESGYRDMYGPAPQVGTLEMTERLLSMGPTEAWMSEVLELVGRIGEEEFSKHLAEIYDLATRS